MKNKLIKHFGEEWYELLKPILETDYFTRVGKNINTGKFSTRKVYPDKKNIFRAFRECPPSKVKVVVLGRGVYDDGTSNGVPFSSSFIGMNGTTKTFLQEIEEDIYNGFILDQNPDLTRLAQQGVLFLGTSLTVEKGKIEESEKMWANFIKFVIKQLSDTYPALVYILRDNFAMAMMPEIDKSCNYIIHSDNVVKNTTFSRTNEILTEVARAIGQNPKDYIIEW